MSGADGLYAYTRRDGQVLLVQWSGGRPVEVLHTHSDRRPKRRTTKRIGDSVTDVVRRAQARRLLLLYGPLGKTRDD